MNKTCYVVKVAKNVSDSGEVIIFADSVEVTDSGDLLFTNNDEDGNERFPLIIGKSYYYCCYIGDPVLYDAIEVHKGIGSIKNLLKEEEMVQRALISVLRNNKEIKKVIKEMSSAILSAIVQEEIGDEFKEEVVEEVVVEEESVTTEN